VQLDGRGCWLWTGAVNAKGYGSTRCGQRTCLAHRLAYEVGGRPDPRWSDARSPVPDAAVHPPPPPGAGDAGRERPSSGRGPEVGGMTEDRVCDGCGTPDPADISGLCRRCIAVRRSRASSAPHKAAQRQPARRFRAPGRAARGGR
jgi:hypothetical protein